MTYPELIITPQPVGTIFKTYINDQTLLVTDRHQYPGIPFGQMHVQVVEQHAEHIEQVKSSYDYTNVIAVGGCTALDFGRACAAGKPLVVIPVVLSSSCLSTNRAVINYAGTYKTIVATAPYKTIVSLPEIMARHARPRNRWTGSGLGDLFSALGASIEYLYKDTPLAHISDTSITELVPECVEALNWIASTTAEALYSPDSFARIARYLHESSVDVLRHGHTELNAGSEHALYYALQEQQRYQKDHATHGQLVSIGTLLTTWIFAQLSDSLFYDNLRAAHKVLGLPLTYADLAAIGVTKSHLLRGLETVNKTHRQWYAKHIDSTVLDKVFA